MTICIDLCWLSRLFSQIKNEFMHQFQLYITYENSITITSLNWSGWTTLKEKEKMHTLTLLFVVLVFFFFYFFFLIRVEHVEHESICHHTKKPATHKYIDKCKHANMYLCVSNDTDSHVYICQCICVSAPFYSFNSFLTQHLSLWGYFVHKKQVFFRKKINKK